MLYKLEIAENFVLYILEIAENFVLYKLEIAEKPKNYNLLHGFFCFDGMRRR